MKKAFALLLALALIGGAVFAEDAAYTLSGSATLTWGYDLETESHGFTNEADAQLTIDFVGEQSSTHGEESITGSIMIEDFSVTLDTDDNPAPLSAAAGDITAKILFPNDLYMTIYSAPGFSISNADLQAPLTDDDWGDLDWAYDVMPSITSAGGFTLGMEGDLSFSLEVGSTNTHTAVAGSANDYMVGVNVGYAIPDMADIGVNFVYGAFSAALPVMGLGVSVDATPVDGLAIYLGSDVKMYNDITGVDLQFDVSYEMADLLSFGAGTYLAIGDLDATAGNPWLGANVRVGVLAVENLTLDLGVDMWDILDANDDGSDSEILIGVDADYTVALEGDNYVMPYAGFNYSTLNELTVFDVGLELGLIPLTTIDINFAAGSLTDNLISAGTSYGSAVGQDKGVFTLAVTIAY